MFPRPKLWTATSAFEVIKMAVNVMNETVSDQNVETTLIKEVSDDDLEKTAGAPLHPSGNYTHFMCTYLDLCPGP